MNYEKLSFEDKSLEGESCCANDDETRHSDIPNADQWFHGQLSRKDAEDRLVRNQFHGSFLIRKSNSDQSIIYVLSYLSEENRITHYKINLTYTWFEIGGNSFRDLKCLIAHYYQTDIIFKEKLKYPVRPPLRPLNEEKEIRFIARMPYCKRPDTNELTFKAGDLFVLEKSCEDGWLWVSVMATRRWGFVHESLLDKASVHPEAVERLPFFHFGTVSSDEVKSMLTQVGPCSYMLRPSEQVLGCYSLYFYDGSKIHKFRIQAKYDCEPCFFHFGKYNYLAIEDLIVDYEGRNIIENPECNLKWSVPRRRDHTCSSLDDDIYESVRMSSHTPAQMPALEVILHGELNIWLKKKKKWKTYYGVLDKKNKSLMLYEKSQVKNIISLEKRKFLPVHSSLHSKKFCFQLVSEGLTSSDACHTIISVEQSLPFIQATDELSQVLKKKLQIETYAGILKFDEDDMLCSPEQSAQRWICNIRPLCKEATPVFALEDKEKREREPRTYRELLVTLNQASSLKHPPVYCVVCIDDTPVAKTQQVYESTREQGDFNFYETFVFEDLASDFKTVSIHIESQKKRLGTVLKQLSDIQTIEGVEKNECINQTSGASIYLKLRYKYLTVLPFKRYSPLKHALIDEMKTSLVPLNEFSFTDVQQMARCLFNVALFNKCHIELIILLFQDEIQQSEFVSMFRKSTLATFLLDEYTKRIAGRWREECLKPVVDSVRKLGDISLEVDEIKFKSDCNVPKEQLCKNQEILKGLLEEAITSIFTSCPSCPLPLRFIYSQLQESVMHRAQKEEFVSSAQSRLICNIVFLRVLCPLLSTSGTWPCSSTNNNPSGIPSEMGLSGIASSNHETSLEKQAVVPESSKRTLTMIAKGLIALPADNALKLDVKFYSSVLEKFKPRLADFINELTCNLNEEELQKLQYIRAQELEDLCRHVSRSRDLADIHAMLNSQLDKIKDSQGARMNGDLIKAIEMMNREKSKDLSL